MKKTMASSVASTLTHTLMTSGVCGRVQRGPTGGRLPGRRLGRHGGCDAHGSLPSRQAARVSHENERWV